MKNMWKSFRESLTTTHAIIGICVVVLLSAWLMSGSSNARVMSELLAFNPTRPWTFLTYPLAPQFSGVMLTALFLWILHQFMSDLERLLVSTKTLIFFLALSFLGGLCFFLGMTSFPSRTSNPPTLGLIAEYIVFTWCVVNPAAQIRLFFVIPIATKVLMWLTIAAVIIENGWGNVPLGFFAALPLLFAWAFAKDRIPFFPFSARLRARTGQKATNEFSSFSSNVKLREKERAERERLRKLFESSLDSKDKEA